jgi:hypothetical protein
MQCGPGAAKALPSPMSCMSISRRRATKENFQISGYYYKNPMVQIFVAYLLCYIRNAV